MTSFSPKKFAEQHFPRMPLVPVAVTFSLGIWLDRAWQIPAEYSMTLAAILIIGSFRYKSPLPIMIWVGAGCIGTSFHAIQIRHIRGNDVSMIISEEPQLVRIRGVLIEEPSTRFPSTNQPLRSRPRELITKTVVEVDAVETGEQWLEISGNVQLTIPVELPFLHVGDRIEATGWIASFREPQNPGERNYAEWATDQSLRGAFQIRGDAENIIRIQPAEGRLIQRGLQFLRHWFQQNLRQQIKHETPLAEALLLGDTQAMSQDEWDRYARTGVIHVLAISGQHLVILAAFIWWICRWFFIPRRQVAILVACLTLGYALLTGGRPSAMRAAVIACTICGGLLLRKPVLPANMMATAWVTVLLLNPADLFNAGFQLSFWCVAMLIWGTGVWLEPREMTPLEQLIDENRSWIERSIRRTGFFIGQLFLTTLVLGLGSLPLTMFWQHMVSISGLLIGPLAIVLTTVALIAGFIAMIAADIPVMGDVAGQLTDYSLIACDWLIQQFADRSWVCWYVSDIPLWWVIGFHLIAIIWLFQSRFFGQSSWSTPLLLLVVWSAVLLITTMIPQRRDEVQVTFLAVDHGNCTVIETPDGRVILVDAGSMLGPEVTKRVIAPFLWHRGYRHIDEVIISHADLDHYNGLFSLADRFHIGQVSVTPTFADKPNEGVQLTLTHLAKHGINTRVLSAGQTIQASHVFMHVLHPPNNGPAGIENVRSMVIHLEYMGKFVLLTGDLEGEGVNRLLETPKVHIDVLLTPHHGSGAIHAEPIAKWCRPKLVIASLGSSDANRSEEVYRRLNIPVWGTWPNGAITLKLHPTGITAESFATKRLLPIR